MADVVATLVVPKRFGLKYEPMPTIAMEYEVQENGTSVLKLLEIGIDSVLVEEYDVEEVLGAIQQAHTELINPRLVSLKQLRRLVTQLLHEGREHLPLKGVEHVSISSGKSIPLLKKPSLSSMRVPPLRVPPASTNTAVTKSSARSLSSDSGSLHRPKSETLANDMSDEDDSWRAGHSLNRHDPSMASTVPLPQAHESDHGRRASLEDSGPLSLSGSNSLPPLEPRRSSGALGGLPPIGSFGLGAPVGGTRGMGALESGVGQGSASSVDSFGDRSAGLGATTQAYPQGSPPESPRQHQGQEEEESGRHPVSARRGTQSSDGGHGEDDTEEYSMEESLEQGSVDEDISLEQGEDSAQGGRSGGDDDDYFS